MTYTVSFAVGGEAVYCRLEARANADSLADVLDAGGMPAKVSDDDQTVVRDDTTHDDDIIDLE